MSERDNGIAEAKKKRNEFTREENDVDAEMCNIVWREWQNSETCETRYGFVHSSIFWRLNNCRRRCVCVCTTRRVSNSCIFYFFKTHVSSGDKIKSNAMYPLEWRAYLAQWCETRPFVVDACDLLFFIFFCSLSPFSSSSFSLRFACHAVEWELFTV